MEQQRFGRGRVFTKKRIRFQCYGVKICVEADDPVYLKKTFELLEKVFPNSLAPAAANEIEYQFYIETRDGGRMNLYRNGETLIEETSEYFFDMVESQIRVTVAEFAAGKVFLHAGVVGWKGRAIVIPGHSFAGKTTLVAELIQQGALYYSDEYAVLDAGGLVEPFPKWLSIRGIIDDDTQLDCSIESLGGRAGIEPLPVGLVLIARYKKEKRMPRRFRPKRLTSGQATMEILRHTLPIRNNPKFVLEVLNKLTTRAIIVKTERGEAKEFAAALLEYLESQTD